ncbi:MAG: subclass B3 metallo-beta-lactamase [Phycisphaerae bacterium]|nr:subclass B3 metallo-beta-lactamase [Gemmatimonadaceae bacterium]
MKILVTTLLAVVVITLPLHAQTEPPAVTATRAIECASCAEWNAPHKPFRLYGNSWFVGTHGLSAILLTSASGHVLIDAGLPESAPLIAANIVSLGFRVEDVKLIVNSHDHFDHAGGIAALQKLSGARVAASASSAKVLERGESESDDPQFGVLLKFPRVSNVSVIKDNEVLKAGDVSLTARFTPGHTPGGTSWSWQSCEGHRCVVMVYADSQTPVSADGFFYSRSKTYPNGVKDFEKGFSVLESLKCDILITPHPDASQLWQRVAARDGGKSEALIDASACKRYAAAARVRLATRLATEAKAIK